MRFLLPLVLCAGPCLAQETPRDVMVVFDMSGSMWGQVDGVAKVEIARDAFGGLLEDWNAGNTRPGLISYGHRTKGDCTDIELLAHPSEGADLSALMADLKPRGKTPLSAAVRQAAETLKFTEEAATVVLLSDGVETCNADPCAVGVELEALGIDFTAHVIGFDIAEADRSQLQCLADATGGQYFDAADADGLADAMKGVVLATAEIVAPPEADPVQTVQPVILRVRMDDKLLHLPSEVIIYSGEEELGRLTDAQAVVPGLMIEVPLGALELRIEGKGVLGETIVQITSQTDIIDLEVSPEDDDYVLWRDRAFPIMGDHIVLINNTTGVDRSSFYRLYLYPAGSTDASERIKAGNLAPNAGIYNKVTVPSPSVAGDYALVPTATDGTEYARVPVHFADEITPLWLGEREVDPSGILDAFWAGSSNRRDGFQFRQDGRTISRSTVEGIAEKDGFKLPAPKDAGLYELIFISKDKDNVETVETSFGLVAVGVALPQDGSAEPVSGNPDIDGLAEETEAMGGEEFPTLPIGDLHGDWQLVFQNNVRTIPLLKTQINHADGETMGGGGFVVEASADWGYGPKGGSGEMTLAHDGDMLLMTLTLAEGTYVSTLQPHAQSDGAWTGDIQTAGDPHRVILMRPEAAAQVDTAPIEHQFLPVDEQGNPVVALADWTLQRDTAGEMATFQSNASATDIFTNQPGFYAVTATSGALYGETKIELGRGLSRVHPVVLKPKDEGANLALDVTYFCSPNEHCLMEEKMTQIQFTLPVGWGAEHPIAQPGGTVQFNMTTSTNDGPFYATLNLPQRSADLGPCFELLQGTFCHDTTDDPKLLADVEILKRTLSFKNAGRPLYGDAFDTLLEKLTGAAQ